MTGAALARKLVGRHNVVLSGHNNRYCPVSMKVYLVAETMSGEDVEALMSAAHECAHLIDHRENDWVRHRHWRSLSPVLVWIEWRIWVAAYDLASRYLRVEDRPAAQAMKWRALGYL